MEIPKIIHQSWKNEEIPPLFQNYVDTWKQNHCEWTYILWTDEMNRRFIENNYPYFLKIYDGYSHYIQRVDAARYFILHKIGGLFIDLDFECLKNIEPLLRGNINVFGCEPIEHCVLHKKKLIISNAFMATVPDSNFFSELCSELAADIPPTKKIFNDILYSTGPFLLTRVYENFYNKQEITLLEDKVIYPLTKTDLLKPDRINQLKSSNSHYTFAIHYYQGTWWKKSIRPN